MTEERAAAHAFLGFARASQSEVLRAAQKDTFYCDSLVEQVQSALSALVDRPLSLRPATIRAATALTYYALTTGRSGQTLGEEYCELTQVAASDRLPASAPRRWLGLLVHVLLPYWTQRIEARLVALARRCEEGQRPLLQAIAPRLRGALRTCEQLHRALFYLGGRYLHAGQRAAGLAQVRHAAAAAGGAVHASLGVLLLAQLAMRGLAALRRAAAARRQARLAGGQGAPGGVATGSAGGAGDGGGDGEADGARTCSLCLAPRCYPTATSCGRARLLTPPFTARPRSCHANPIPLSRPPARPPTCTGPLTHPPAPTPPAPSQAHLLLAVRPRVVGWQGRVSAVSAGDHGCEPPLLA